MITIEEMVKKMVEFRKSDEKETCFDITENLKIFIETQIKEEEDGLEFSMSVQNIKTNECYAVATADYDDEPNIEWALNCMRECAIREQSHI